MGWAAVALGLCLPLIAGCVGWRLGLGRMLRRLLRGMLTAALASAVLLLGLRLAWPAALLWPAVLLLVWAGWRLSGCWAGRRHRRVHHPRMYRTDRLPRLAGAGGGIATGLLGNLLLGLLLAGWGRPQSTPTPAPTVDPEAARQHNGQVLAGLASAGAELADWTNRSLLAHLPGGHSCGSELAATLRLIRAEPAALDALAVEHDLLALAERPAVAAALADPAYLASIDELGRGALWRLPAIVDHPLTRRLLDDAELRRRLRSLRPSQLAAGLTDTPAASATTASAVAHK